MTVYQFATKAELVTAAVEHLAQHLAALDALLRHALEILEPQE